MTEALLQYSSEFSSSRITAATRVRYVNKQLMVYWQLPNLVDHTADPPNLRLEAISPVVVGADNFDIYELRVRSYLVYLNRR